MSSRIGYSLQTVTQLLTKIQEVDIVNSGWNRLPSTEKDPVFLDSLITPGNYSAAYWRQGPQGIMSTIPINLVVSDKGSKITQTVFYLDTVFERNYYSDAESWTGWTQLQALNDAEFGSNEPPNPCNNMVWFDTSSGKPILKMYNSAVAEWIDIRPDKMMKVSVYDTQGIASDVYLYVASQIEAAGLNDARTAFEAHTSNDSIHITQEDRNTWNSAQDDSENDAIITNLKQQYIQDIATMITTAGNTLSEVEQWLDTTAITSLNTHIGKSIVHPDTTKQSEWIAKPNQYHEHFLDGYVAIQASAISGIISKERFNAGALERGIKVTDDASRLALTESDVQDGDSVYVISTRISYFVVDQTKLGTEEAFIQFTTPHPELSWTNIDPDTIPNTVEGFGITDAYTVTAYNQLVSPIKSDATSLLTYVSNTRDYFADYNLSDSTFTWFETQKTEADPYLTQFKQYMAII